jgi:hypothetical protein
MEPYTRSSQKIKQRRLPAVAVDRCCSSIGPVLLWVVSIPQKAPLRAAGAFIVGDKPIKWTTLL